MITVKDIIKKFLDENNYSGLWHDEGPCGCDGSAPCSDGPYPECCAAIAGPGGEDADGQMCDVLYYPDPRTMEEIEADKKYHCRMIRPEEIEFAKRIHSEKAWPENQEVKDDTD